MIKEETYSIVICFNQGHVEYLILLICLEKKTFNLIPQHYLQIVLYLKDEVRICKVVYDTEIGAKYGGQPLWHHVSCFAKQRNELLFFAGGESIPGFDTLKKEDQKIVKTEIK